MLGEVFIFVPLLRSRLISLRAALSHSMCIYRGMFPASVSVYVLVKCATSHTLSGFGRGCCSSVGFTNRAGTALYFSGSYSIPSAGQAHRGMQRDPKLRQMCSSNVIPVCPAPRSNCMSDIHKPSQTMLFVNYYVYSSAFAGQAAVAVHPFPWRSAVSYLRYYRHLEALA